MSKLNNLMMLVGTIGLLVYGLLNPGEYDMGVAITFLTGGLFDGQV